MPTTHDITNTDDTIDVRDVIARFEELMDSEWDTQSTVREALWVHAPHLKQSLNLS